MQQDTGDLTKRISFAESWLARARQQIEAGRPERGILTLVLAAAEVRLAREAGAVARPRSDRRGRSGWLAAGVAALAAAALICAPVLHTAVPVDTSGGQAPPIVTLSDGKGSLLGLVTDLPPATVRTVTRTVVVRVPVRVRGASPQAAPSPGSPTVQRALERLAAGASVSVAAAAAGASAPAATVAVPAQHALLSEADVIELVLAAERALRRTSNQ